ncbi:MAG: hypothetical protein M1820_005978 [Bogoriella megaspora]|nr:MAG: hypothetical protein M1820_005978 [Bogoriella megaspora]
MDQQTVKIPRVDAQEGDYVLANVCSNGPLPLDIRIEATEGTSPYIGSLQESQKELGQRAKNYHGSNEEWKSILLHCFSRRRSLPSEASALRGLEVVAQLANQALVIVFRKNVGGITQRLGTVTLKQNDEMEISILDWAARAVDAGSKALEEVSSLEAKFAEQQKTVNKLNAELNVLIKVKQEHEDALLYKFQQLLNSKKLKIRDQQRLLAGAKVDPTAAMKVHESRQGGAHRKATPSRKGKRKADAQPTEEAKKDATGETDVEEQEDVASLDDEDMRQATPEKSDLDATEDDEGSEDEFGAMPCTFQRKAQGVGSKGKAMETITAQDDDVPPPRRVLPFQRREQETAPTTGESKKIIHDDESTDDEL